MRLFTNGLIAATAVLLSVAFIELGLRVALPQPLGVIHHDPYGLPVHWPGLVTYLPRFGQRISFNSAGMRDREHALAKPPGTCRVLVLGDSFMEALQVRFDSSFPALLERGLAAESRNPIEVVSAGVGGWGTAEQLRYLTDYGLSWSPDLVLIMMTLHNDISDNLREQFYSVRNGVLTEQPRRRASVLGYKLVQLKSYLATHSHFFQLLRKARLNRQISTTGKQLRAHVVDLLAESTPPSIVQGFELTELLLEEIRSLTMARSGRVVLVLLPLQTQVSDARFAAFVRTAADTTSQMHLDEPQRYMRAIADRLGLPVIDLLPGFREWTATGGSALYLKGDGHWTEGGHRLAAAMVAKELRRHQPLPWREIQTPSGPDAEAHCIALPEVGT